MVKVYEIHYGGVEKSKLAFDVDLLAYAKGVQEGNSGYFTSSEGKERVSQVLYIKEKEYTTDDVVTLLYGYGFSNLPKAPRTLTDLQLPGMYVLKGSDPTVLNTILFKGRDNKLDCISMTKNDLQDLYERREVECKKRVYVGADTSMNPVYINGNNLVFYPEVPNYIQNSVYNYTFGGSELATKPLKMSKKLAYELNMNNGQDLDEIVEDTGYKGIEKEVFNKEDNNKEDKNKSYIKTGVNTNEYKYNLVGAQLESEKVVANKDLNLYDLAYNIASYVTQKNYGQLVFQSYKTNKKPDTECKVKLDFIDYVVKEKDFYRDLMGEPLNVAFSDTNVNYKIVFKDGVEVRGISFTHNDAEDIYKYLASPLDFNQYRKMYVGLNSKEELVFVNINNLKNIHRETKRNINVFAFDPTDGNLKSNINRLAYSPIQRTLDIPMKLAKLIKVNRGENLNELIIEEDNFEYDSKEVKAENDSKRLKGKNISTPIRKFLLKQDIDNKVLKDKGNYRTNLQSILLKSNLDYLSDNEINKIRTQYIKGKNRTRVNQNKTKEAYNIFELMEYLKGYKLITLEQHDPKTDKLNVISNVLVKKSELKKYSKTYNQFRNYYNNANIRRVFSEYQKGKQDYLNEVKQDIHTFKYIELKDGNIKHVGAVKYYPKFVLEMQNLLGLKGKKLDNKNITTINVKSLSNYIRKEDNFDQLITLVNRLKDIDK